MIRRPVENDMFARIERARKRKRKPRRACDECGKVVAHFKSGKPYRHNCDS